MGPATQTLGLSATLSTSGDAKGIRVSLQGSDLERGVSSSRKRQIKDKILRVSVIQEAS